MHNRSSTPSLESIGSAEKTVHAPMPQVFQLPCGVDDRIHLTTVTGSVVDIASERGAFLAVCGHVIHVPAIGALRGPACPDCFRFATVRPHGHDRFAPIPGWADCPAFDRDAVPLGPFALGPTDLFRHLHRTPDGEIRQGPELRDCLRRWLIDALDDVGVALGGEDMLLITSLAEQGSDAVQIVTGWVARAHHPSGAASSDPSRSRVGIDER